MATFKPILQKTPDKSGKHSIIIRITKNRIHSYVTFPQRIQLKDWRDGRIKNPKINNLLLKFQMELSEKSIELETINKNCTSHDIKGYFLGDKTNLFDFAHDFYKKFDNDRQRLRYEKYCYSFKLLREYIRTRNRTVLGLDYTTLNRFHVYLSQRVGTSTLKAIFSCISAVLNEAVRQEKVRANPILKIKIKRPNITVKTPLSTDEIYRLRTYILPNGAHHARNFFLLQVYFRGMRAGDLICMKKKLIGDRLPYGMRKTGDPFSMEIEPQAREIIEEYINLPGEYLFPFYDRTGKRTKNKESCRRINSVICTLNRQLKLVAIYCNIKKNLSTHVARHTWNNLGRQAGIPIEIRSQMLGHESIKTTRLYDIGFPDIEMDEAHKKIIALTEK